jgi:flagellar FliL protein
MADDFLDGDDDVVATDDVGSDGGGGGQKVGFLPAIVIQILKWAVIVVGAIIFIVTVVVVTLNIMGAGQPGQDRVPRSESYEGPPPEYSWYQEIAELRGVTRDQVPRTFVVEIRLGYELENSSVSNSLIGQTIPLTDMLNTWFASQFADYLLDITNREEIRKRLLAEVQKIVPEVEQVAFTKYQVLDF